MAKYVKKPIEIEAVEVTSFMGGADLFLEFQKLSQEPKWIKEALTDGTLVMKQNASEGSWYEINTLEGTMKVSSGDYIIRGISGELYPCKPDIFKQTYDKVR